MPSHSREITELEEANEALIISILKKKENLPPPRPASETLSLVPRLSLVPLLSASQLRIGAQRRFVPQEPVAPPEPFTGSVPGDSAAPAQLLSPRGWIPCPWPRTGWMLSLRREGVGKHTANSEEFGCIFSYNEITMKRGKKNHIYQQHW